MLYKNKEWLKEQYVTKKLQLKEIGKLCGADRRVVRNWINKFNIRNGSEYKHGQTIYSELNNRDWLYQKYIIEKLSMIQIQKLIGVVQSNSVRQSLIRFNIPTRNLRDGIIRNTPDNLIINKEVIDGSLLGDAGLHMFNKKSKICRPCIYKVNKHFNHLNWFAEYLLPKESINIKKKTQILEYKNKKIKCQYYSFHTQSSDKLMEYFNRWYPVSNNYIKLVPRDIVLTPLTVLNWFLDDGSSTWRDRTKEGIQKTKQVTIQFCSESFTKKDNLFLIEKFKEIGIRAHLRRSSKGSQWRINISQLDTNKFFEYIGKCPVPELEYKWKTI